MHMFSEARVLETTLAIFLEHQTKGLTLDPLQSSMAEVVARMNVPLWEWAVQREIRPTWLSRLLRGVRPGQIANGP